MDIGKSFTPAYLVQLGRHFHGWPDLVFLAGICEMQYEYGSGAHT